MHGLTKRILFFQIKFLAPESEVDFSELSTLWVEVKLIHNISASTFCSHKFSTLLPLPISTPQDQRDFGELQILEVNLNEGSNQLTQIDCSCGRDCSGIFFIFFHFFNFFFFIFFSLFCRATLYSSNSSS